MINRSKLLAFAAPLAVLALAGCGPRAFRADVARFQQMPAPAGQSFVVQAQDPRLQGGLEFQQYAGLVTSRLAQQGYRPVEGGTGAASPTFVVAVDYGIDNGHEKVVTRPGIGYGGGFGGWGGGFGGWGGGFGPWGYGGFGRGGFGRGWYGGWADPLWYQPFGYPEVSSYTYYVSFLTVRISDAASGRVLFEGRARARSVDNSLPHLIPNLVEAMFTGFPGRSGEDVLITVPPPPKPGAQAPVNR